MESISHPHVTAAAVSAQRGRLGVEEQVPTHPRVPGLPVPFWGQY